MAIPARGLDEGSQQRAPHATRSMGNSDGDSNLRCLGVDEAVGVLANRPQPKPARADAQMLVLNDQSAVARAAPAGDQSIEFGISSELGQLRPGRRWIPEKRLEEH